MDSSTGSRTRFFGGPTSQHPRKDAQIPVPFCPRIWILEMFFFSGILYIEATTKTDVRFYLNLRSLGFKGAS